jgi:hypothetical protein
MSGSSSDDDYKHVIHCGVAGCFENATEKTPCCHELMCDDCYARLVVPECENETCPGNDEEICKLCLDLNGKQCDCA